MTNTKTSHTNPARRSLHVLVIDDSAVVREVMMSLLSHEADMRVTVAADAIIAMEMGLAPVETLAAQNRLLKTCGLPTRLDGIPASRIMKHLGADKKIRAGRLRFALPEAVGRVRYPVEVPRPLVLSAIRNASR